MIDYFSIKMIWYVINDFFVQESQLENVFLVYMALECIQHYNKAIHSLFDVMMVVHFDFKRFAVKC